MSAQVAGEPAVKPPVYERAMERRNPISADTVTRSEVRPVQFATPAGHPEIIQAPPDRPCNRDLSADSHIFSQRRALASRMGRIRGEVIYGLGLSTGA